MYESFYEMKATPFTRGIPCESMYMPHELDEICNRLKLVAKRQLFAVVTGDCGTGKTTIIRKLRDSLNPNHYYFLYVSDSKLTPGGFYRTLLEQMGYSAKRSRNEAKRQLHEAIDNLKTLHGIETVCVCDECHLLSREMLEEIRFLLNTELDSKSPMGLILVGQSELWKKLKKQAYAAIFQRIDIQCFLNHYDRSQTGAYIANQLKYSGVEHDIFSDSAIDQIFDYTSGTARMIDKVCTSLLLYGSQSRLQIIDERAVKLVLECEFS